MKCAARKSNGEPCGAWAIKGSRVCRVHGGSARQVRNKAAERVLETRLGGELQKRKITPVTEPSKALAEVAGTVLEWMDVCHEQMAQLSRLDYSNDKRDQDVRPAIALFERSLERSVATLSKMISLGIQDRVARSAELTAEANLQALRGLIRAARATDASEEELLVGLVSGTM